MGRWPAYVKTRDLRAVQVDAVLVGGGATETEGLGSSQAVRYCPPSIPGVISKERVRTPRIELIIGRVRKLLELEVKRIVPQGGFVCDKKFFHDIPLLSLSQRPSPVPTATTVKLLR